MTNKNKLLVPQSESALEQMKAEIAQEFGVQLGADATARQNGLIGGMMTKRLIQLAQEQLSNHN